MSLEDIGIKIPEILLPAKGINLYSWAVIACDQFTSQPEYWSALASEVGDLPSTLHLIFPEVYLGSNDEDVRIEKINRYMESYLQQGIVETEGRAMILVDRETPHAPSRKGLVVALDLDLYDYRQGAKTLIRTTEGTIVDRLPPRIKVRQAAALELPHIMVLIDDPGKSVIEPLFETVETPCYDTDLMMGGGRIRGYRVARDEQISQVENALKDLADIDRFQNKYKVDDTDILLYAMGDGNHSFATARAIWEKIKEEAEDKEAVMQHPARYALVELVNIHDPGLEFEAIHRVLFDVELSEFLLAMEDFCCERLCGMTVFSAESEEDLNVLKKVQASANSHLLPFVSEKGFGLIKIHAPTTTLEVASLQAMLDEWLPSQPQATLDYIHGEDVVTRLGGEPGNIGFYLPAIDKSDFFRSIVVDGALPRKTFSMGEAEEKRYYLECRKLT